MNDVDLASLIWVVEPIAAVLISEILTKEFLPALSIARLAAAESSFPVQSKEPIPSTVNLKLELLALAQNWMTRQNLR